MCEKFTIMPSASAIDVEKAKPEITDSCSKLCIKFLEHKIRNLEKRKGKLESYRQLKTNGKKLDADQIQAISKYEEVSATLDFARDVVKTMVSYALQAAQDQKFESQKQKEKELANIKLILELQDILAQLQIGDVRQNFINGVNGAVQISEERINQLEAFYKEVYPESSESEKSSISSNEKRVSAAQHIQNFLEANAAAVVGTTYEELKKTVDEIKSCDYFAEIPVIIPKVPVFEIPPTAVEPEAPAPAPVEPAEIKLAEPAREIETAPFIQQNNIPVPPTANLQENNSFYSDPVPAAVSSHSHFLAKKEAPVQPLSGIANNSTFNFFQESELDSPPEAGLNLNVGVTPTPPPASALPIPSQTFTNPLYIPPPPIPMPPSHLQQPQSPSNVPLQAVPAVPQAPVTVPLDPEPQVTSWTNESWGAQSEPIETQSWANEDWVGDPPSDQYQGMSDWDPPRQESGFVTQGRSGYRGSGDGRSRGRGRGGRGRGGRGRDGNINDYSSRKSDGYQNTNGYLGKDRSEHRDRSDRPDRGDRSDRGNGFSRRGGGPPFNRSSSGYRRGSDRGERVDRGDRGERVDRGDRGERLDRGDRPSRGDRMDRNDRFDKNGTDSSRKGSSNYSNDRGSYSNRASRGSSSGRGRNPPNNFAA